MSEFEYINWVRQRIPAHSRVLIGPGDDAASVEWSSGKPCLITTDMLLQGSCFLLEQTDPRLIGRKALAVNLSDIAAMAGRPVAAVVSVALPRVGGRKLAEQLYEGLSRIAGEFDTAIVGGDTNSWDGPLAINVTVIGEPTGSGPVRRSGAEPGDWILATGEFGGSILGKHLTFTPRVREAQRLHSLVRIKAMIDVSDGLSADLHHLCEESGCGAILEESMIPISEAARQMREGKSALEHALSDGEDFELLFAASPSEGRWLLRDQPLAEWGVSVHRLGEFVPEGFRLRTSDGVVRDIEPRGYVHEFDGGSS
ncbi:MAG: thiamine-phosphate kinase [Gemmatales bacterium]|nr:thiamine-phosphate kinase [Gemmatales bacterium]MDW8386213.1 thiamine-phosphate kinase [Gemmatales bacterium]